MAITVFLEFLCLLASVITFGIWIASLRGRGRVLLDFGPDPMRKPFLAIGILCLLSAILCAATAWSSSKGPNWNLVLLAPLQLAIAVQFLFRTTGRAQITEFGIWQNLSLLRWEAIGSYRWLEDSTLFAVRGQGPVCIKLPVPPEHKPAVAELLTRHGLTEAAV